MLTRYFTPLSKIGKHLQHFESFSVQNAFSLA